jgi:hypothetical protein
MKEVQRTGRKRAWGRQRDTIRRVNLKHGRQRERRESKTEKVGAIGESMGQGSKGICGRVGERRSWWGQRRQGGSKEGERSAKGGQREHDARQRNRRLKQ